MDKKTFPQLKKWVDTILEEAYQEALTSYDVPVSEIQRLLPKLKEEILKKRGIDIEEYNKLEKDFDRTQGVALTQDQRNQVLYEVRNEERIRTEQNFRQEKEKENRKIRKSSLIEKFKDRFPLLSKEQLENEVEKIVEETDRVFGSSTTREKAKYQEELLKKFEEAQRVVQEGESKRKQKKIEELLEEAEIEKEYRKIFPEGVSVIDAIRQMEEKRKEV